MSTSEHPRGRRRKRLASQRCGTFGAGQPALRGQHPARFRQSAAVGAGCPARQRARHNGGRLGRSDGGWLRGSVPGAGSAARCLRRLPSCSDVAGTGAATTGGAGAPRGNVPDTTAGPSTAATSGGIADPFVPADLSAFAVPSEGIVPTLPGVLAGGVPTVPVAPRGSAPSWPTGAPSVPELGWTDKVPVGADAPAGDEGNYHFLTAADPVAAAGRRA